MPPGAELPLVAGGLAVLDLLSEQPASPATTQAAATIPINIPRFAMLDRPLPAQFLAWADHALHGDLGQSFLFHEKVSHLIGTHFPVTLTLGVLAIGIAIIVAIPLGILAALNEGRAVDMAIGFVALAGQAVPSFWLGLLLIVWFGIDLHWLRTCSTRQCRRISNDRVFDGGIGVDAVPCGGADDGSDVGEEFRAPV